MEIIVPAAGLSSRFPNLKPKYMLTDYTGKSMLHRAVEPFLGKYPITIGILKDHHIKYDALNVIKKELGNNADVVILDNLTSGPAETVFQILLKSNINPNNKLFIKDCDSYFKHTELPGNYICISKVENHDAVHKIHNKSFVIVNNQNFVTKIVEKQVVSNTFCVGGYCFMNGNLFLENYGKIGHAVQSEFFLSHIIQDLILQSHVFQVSEVSDYVDVGTLADWNQYNKPADFNF